METFFAIAAGCGAVANVFFLRSAYARLKVSRWIKRLRKTEERLKKYAQKYPHRFLQEAAPEVTPKADNINFPSPWLLVIEKAFYAHIGPIMAMLACVVAALSVGGAQWKAIWAGLAAAYAIPTVHFIMRTNKVAEEAKLFERLALVQLCLYLSNPDAERKRVVERLARAKSINRFVSGGSKKLYANVDPEKIRTAARTTWYAADGYCEKCGERRECRPVVAEEPYLPAKVEAECLKCGSKARIPRRVIGVIGPQDAKYEYR
ncbi:MAG: hypothetical protein NZ534_06115, partial [Bacteroidia bacterium]|nr:hypothetical protein [Bacteroidia bacterium]